MGLIANQMAIEIYYKIKQNIQDKTMQKKNLRKTDKTEKRSQ